MIPNQALQDVLSRYKRGEISLESAAEEIEGIRLDHIGDFACLDLGRAMRCGMPEVVLAEGKDSAHLAQIAVRHTEATGRCIITRVIPEQVVSIKKFAENRGIETQYHEAGRVLGTCKGNRTESYWGCSSLNHRRYL